MLFAPTLADRAILPTAWEGRYFFNRIGQKRTVGCVYEKKADSFCMWVNLAAGFSGLCQDQWQVTNKSALPFDERVYEVKNLRYSLSNR
jgi:hypothetical protein